MWLYILIITLFGVLLLVLQNTFGKFSVVRKIWKRDLRMAYRLTKLLFNMWMYARKDGTVPKLFSKTVRRHPMKVAFYFEDRAWPFEKVERLSNQVAAYFYSQGFKRGECIALLLESRPEYVCIWLGLAKIGIITALINTNLLSTTLVHSLKTAPIKALIYGNSFANTVNDIVSQLENVIFYRYNTNSEIPTKIFKENHILDLEKALKKEPEKLTNVIRAINKMSTTNDPLFYQYTSGTTGLPKAAIITHSRYIAVTLSMFYMPPLTVNDILYTTLPLYHPSGGIAGCGLALIVGLSVVLRQKFSASHFWSDIGRYNCTATQYIGDLCRYLLIAHRQNPNNFKPSTIRVMVGNGLRPQIWKEFINTFKISQLCEFYGSTEGNTYLLNFDSKEGAIGFVPHFLTTLWPILLLKCGEDGTLIKNESGFCLRCKANERGLCVGKIDNKRMRHKFCGYVDTDETNKKIIRNVFERGDMYFNSGDILEFDELGYYYFRDRIGDTYRWKGENVSTAEVEGIISKLTGLQDAVVYGVEIPGTEGKVGMACYVNSQLAVDIKELGAKLLVNVPRYAIPMFVRVRDKIPSTGTFRLQKYTLQKEAFHIGCFTDPVYYFNSSSLTYELLTEHQYNSILQGNYRI